MCLSQNIFRLQSFLFAMNLSVHFRYGHYFADDWLRKKIDEDSVQREFQLLNRGKRKQCIRSKTLFHILSVFLILIECIVWCIKNYSETSAYYSSA